MSFAITSTEMEKRLSGVIGVVPPKAVLPIIQNVHLIIEGAELSLQGTDLENTIKIKCEVENLDAEKIDVAVQAKALLDILKALPEQPLTFKFDKDKMLMHFTSDYGEYRISCSNGLDFPIVPKMDGTTKVDIPSDVIKRALEKTLFAASTEEIKQNMNGALFSFKKDGATIVTTDAHRLVRYKRDDIKVGKEFEFILPLKGLKLLGNTLAGSSEATISMEYNKRNVFFQIGNTLLVSRLVDANFPPYQTVIPTKSSNKATINRKELLGSLKRMDVFSNKTNHLTMFELSGNVLKFNAEDQEFANAADESMHCLYEGADLKIGFDVRYMMEILSRMETDDIVLELETPGRAAVFMPTMQEEKEDMLMLLMPVMLGNY